MFVLNYCQKELVLDLEHLRMVQSFGAGPVTPRGFRFVGCNFSKPSRLSRRGSVCDSSLCIGPWSHMYMKFIIPQ